MGPSSNKALIGLLSITTFLLFSFLISANIHIAAFGPGRYMPSLAALITSINASILFAFFAFDTIYGMAFTAVSAITVMWLSLKAGVFSYSLFTLPYLFTACIGRYCMKKYGSIEHSFNLKLEKLAEDFNLMANTMKVKNESIIALREKVARYAALKGVIESLSTHLAIEDLTALIAENADRTVAIQGRSLVYLINAERQELMLSASRGEMKVKEKQGDVFDLWVLRHRKPLFIEDISQDFRFSTEDITKAQERFSSLISSPLISGNKLIGILRVDSAKENAFTQDDLRLLNIVSDLGAVTLHNAILYARAQELAVKDSLTGLYVRRYFAERLEEEIKRSALKKAGLAILMIDIDNFKDYNDKYGHTSGDLVLKHLSKTIASMVIEGDIVARYGGEEIVVLLNGKGRRAASLLAEEMRRAVKDRPLNLRRHEARITVSIGVSASPENGTAPDDLIRAADERLYRAKKEGRNRVCSS